MKKTKKDLPTGWIESFTFDPRTCTGEIIVATVGADNKPKEITKRLHEAGGYVIGWDGDERGLSLFDRYQDFRKSLIAKCPEGFPIPEAVLLTPDVSVRFRERRLSEAAIKFIDYANKNAEALELVANGPVG